MTLNVQRLSGTLRAATSPLVSPSASLVAAINARAGKTLDLAAGDYVLDGDVATDVCTVVLRRGATITVPVSRAFGCHVEWAGGRFAVAAGATLTLSGTIHAPEHAWLFDCSASGSSVRIAAGAATTWVADRWFGARGDWNGTSGTDDSRAVELALNAFADKGGVVRRTRGKFRLTRAPTPPVEALGLSMLGSGKYATTDVYDGVATDDVLYRWDRSTDCSMGWMSIEVASGRLLHQAVQTVQLPLTGTQKSSHFTLDMLRLEGGGLCTFGWYNRLGQPKEAVGAQPDADTKNDFHLIRRCDIRGTTYANVVIEGRNALSIGFEDTVLSQGDYGIDTRYYPDPTDTSVFWPQHGGSWHWKGGAEMMSGHDIADIIVGDRNDPVSIEKLHSENSYQLLLVPDYSALFPLFGGDPDDQFETYEFSIGHLAWKSALGDSAENIITWEAGGTLRIESYEVGVKAAANPDPHRVDFAPKNGVGDLLLGGGTWITGERGGLFPAQQPTFLPGAKHRRVGIDLDQELLPLRDNASGKLHPWTVEQNLALGQTPPTWFWPMQDDGLRGRAHEQFGGIRRRHLTPSGSPMFRVFDWDSVSTYYDDRYHVQFDGSNDQGLRLGTAPESDPNTNSVAWGGEFKLTGTPADETHGFLNVFGNGTNSAGQGGFARITTAGKFQINVDGTNYTGTYDYRDGLRHRYRVVWCRELQTFFAVVTKGDGTVEVITGVWVTSLGNTSNKGFGAHVSSAGPAPMKHTFGKAWIGPVVSRFGTAALCQAEMLALEVV